MFVLEIYPSYREQNIKGVKKGRDQRSFYRGVRLVEVSVKRESTVSHTIIITSDNVCTYVAIKCVP